MLDPLTTLPDGTIKQVNPFTGTKVWTLPGRGRRPIDRVARPPLPIDPADADRICAFCPERVLETTPEIARLVRDEASADGWREVRGLTAEQVAASPADFRLVPNLFEILSFDYWHLTHGWEPTAEMTARRETYLSTPVGREHVERLARIRIAARSAEGTVDGPLTDAEVEREATGLFAGNHLLVVARRHFEEGARDDSRLRGSGRLTPEEHRTYVDFSIGTMRDVYRDNEHARYVSVFQNWLQPAGASFDHLHKQVVAIDELGADLEREVEHLAQEPDLYERWGQRYAAERGLLVARTPSAVAFVGIGHRFPSLEVHSLVTDRCPWELTSDEVRDFADLLHACHAATGVEVPSNEEWHHRPPSVDLPMPLRAVLKWRISTLAGFEGGTKIYVNTVSPWSVHERVVGRLRGLVEAGAVSATVRPAD
ncbi:DUF4921 family protein [Intrasporangium calvum]|uniref:DUF4921 domain-containing protein n=1 Tax=Intrasporangium calvum (strain ATCC 23552 / DSM 43043 / JCM 3097 / NBRC 12989 / NCIMB 10167 / NRRL B-3866 / 7 KIP) TaxID=710696 RepID=E6SF49_INTC7|nr:DUF4921 family protein [Intrasporangium calvum]ADU49863.1 hypothetical protein Intca_3382 [Intrasporangium calvum DSM 43043]AXG14709.1 DUF4921 family protein [Intrasporangium calvum]